MKPITVCILTAGKGTRMGGYSSIINKALLPIQQKAILSHIISRFPKHSEFVIGLGYMKEQVRNYLGIAHPHHKFHFIEVDNFDGPESGPGYSLLCCRSALQKPFYFVSCDTLWTKDLCFDHEHNWVGAAQVPDGDPQNYCNLEIHNNRVIAIRDKEKVKGEKFQVFTGLMFIKDYKVFWDSLKDLSLVDGEHQVSNGIHGIITKTEIRPFLMDWIDVGTLDKYKNVVSCYENFDFSKSNEFLYVFDGRVIKFFADQSITNKRIEKARINSAVFPKVTHHQDQFYAYDFIPGKTLYQKNSLRIFSDLLGWLDKKLWIPRDCPSEELYRTCEKFYYDKTMKRLELYQQKYEIDQEERRINGVQVPDIQALMDQVPWDLVKQGVSVFMHGDLQFDNILLTEEATEPFLLLDWRQEFGGYVEFGDLYYDLAKLYGGIILNYDYIKLGLLQYFEKGEEIYLDFAQRYSTLEYASILEDFIMQKRLSVKKV